MKTVILAGGKGLRYSSDIPKSLAPIGDKPIIEHVMDIYANQGYNNFVLCLGYKKEKIIEHFDNDNIKHDYNITFVDTGENANTGRRIRLIEEYIPKDDKNFFCTYADGIANVNLLRLEAVHCWKKNVGTITVVRPYNQFGVVRLDNNDQIKSFEEKPRMSEYTNGGFFIFDKKIFDYIEDNDELEIQVFNRLVDQNKLGAYKHEGFWDTLNTPKDEIRLNGIYDDFIKSDRKPEWYIADI